MERTPPRLVVQISEEQYFALQRLIPHGLKTALFRTIIDDMITLLEDEDPQIVIGAFVSNQVVYDITDERRNDE